MVSNTPNESTLPRELTGEEAALYDRQIRLWGVDAQRRLAASRVLIAGSVKSFLAQELAKNLVLSGIASLSFVLTHDDSSSLGGFLGPSVGRISASLSEINPLVQVSCVDFVRETDRSIDAIEKLIDPSITVACVVDCDSGLETDFSSTCRKMGTPFFCGRALGPVGYFFVDLGAKYEYTVDIVDNDRSDTHDASACNSQASNVEKRVEYFISFTDALASMWGCEPRRSDCGWHIACCAREFELETGRLPGSDPDADALLMAKIYTNLQGDRSPLRVNTALMDCVARTGCHSLPPVSAVVGGMWGREVIKVLSRKDDPLNNFFFFSAKSSQGCVERIDISDMCKANKD